MPRLKAKKRERPRDVEGCVPTCCVYGFNLQFRASIFVGLPSGRNYDLGSCIAKTLQSYVCDWKGVQEPPEFCNPCPPGVDGIGGNASLLGLRKHGGNMEWIFHLENPSHWVDALWVVSLEAPTTERVSLQAWITPPRISREDEREQGKQQRERVEGERTQRKAREDIEQEGDRGINRDKKQRHTNYCGRTGAEAHLRFFCPQTFVHPTVSLRTKRN